MIKFADLKRAILYLIFTKHGIKLKVDSIKQKLGDTKKNILVLNDV